MVYTKHLTKTTLRLRAGTSSAHLASQAASDLGAFFSFQKKKIPEVVDAVF
jgi:hypothetical protein